MKTIYILMKHENTIEEDFVEILKVSKDLESTKDEYNEIKNALVKKYEIIEETGDYTSFTNEYKEILIELMIEKENIS